MLAFTALWAALTLGEHLTGTYQLRVIFSKLSFVGITGTPAATLLFALLYSGREQYVNRRSIALLAVEPVLANLLVWTTEYHELWYAVVDGQIALSVHGAGFFVHLVYSYGLMLISVGLLFDVIRRQQSLFQRQSIAIGFAALLPLGVNAVSIAFLPADMTPVAFSLSGAALLWAILRADLTTLSPIARERIVDDMNSGVLVVNQQDVVVDLNGNMRSILRLGDAEVVGRTIDDVLANYESIRERFHREVDAQGELTVETADSLRHYSIEVSPLHDHRKHQIGRLFLVHDITEQKRRQRELERKNEQLDQFASLVSHDLRNPLNVADGVLDIAEESGDPEDFDEVREMHDRMQNLIEDLLTLAREGDDVDETETVDLGQVVDEAWSTVETGDATLTNECQGFVVRADRHRLLQVLENLFRNAVEHGATNDPFHVEVGRITTHTTDPSQKGFYVADDGVGIPEAERDTVLDHGYTTKEDGTGLGLTIIDQIVRAHGWELDITESQAGGARFEIKRVASLTEGPTLGTRAIEG